MRSNAPAHSSGSTSSAASTYSVSYRSIPPLKTVFEVNGRSSNGTLWELPANTTIWETFTLNGTSFIKVVEAGFEYASSSAGSTIHVGVYVDGELTSSSSYSTSRPSLEANGSFPSIVSAAFPVVVDREFPGGTSITVAAVCNGNLYTYMYRTGVSFVSASPSLPNTLSVDSASTQEPFQFWASGTTS